MTKRVYSLHDSDPYVPNSNHYKRLNTRELENQGAVLPAAAGPDTIADMHHLFPPHPFQTSLILGRMFILRSLQSWGFSSLPLLCHSCCDGLFILTIQHETPVSHETQACSFLVPLESSNPGSSSCSDTIQFFMVYRLIKAKMTRQQL